MGTWYVDDDRMPSQPGPAFGDSMGAMTIAGGIAAALLKRERRQANEEIAWLNLDISQHDVCEPTRNKDHLLDFSTTHMPLHGFVGER